MAQHPIVHQDVAVTRTPYPAPVGATARRVEWHFLPPWLRAEIEHICGSPVVSAESRDSGFTPGMASVLTCADGTRHFVKAASDKAQRMFAHSYRAEAAKHEHLPPGTPAPELLWIRDADDWIVLGFEYVEARAPHRPWTSADLTAALAATARVAELLTPPPPALVLDPIATELAAFPALWAHVRASRPDLPHLEEAAALAAEFATVTVGNTLVHTDLRDDNLLIRPDGEALICDWNWPVLGAAWVDTVLLLVGPRGDGHDVDALLATNPLTSAVPRDSIDSVIALITGYFFHSGDQPVPPTSPHIRDHQLWQAQVCWDWLAERRGWSS